MLEQEELYGSWQERDSDLYGEYGEMERRKEYQEREAEDIWDITDYPNPDEI